MKNLICHILAVAIMLQSVAVPAARAAAVVQNPTRVAASRANIGGTECEQIYAGCMDQFCTSGNENAGRCLCSNDFQRIDEEWTRLGAAEIELANLTARAVEDIEAGAAAEINRAATPRTPAPSRARASQAAALALFNEHSREADPNDISNLTGAARLAAADRMCRPRLPANCNLALTRTWYQQTLRSDCRAYELVVENRRRQGAAQERLARQSIRDAAAASFEHANRFNSGDCLMNFMECMREDTACGRTWENCLHGRLAQNRMKCEHILDQCINVREFVWTNFVRLATPEIETAQVIAASDMRQSCLRDVSNCIGRACADMIGTGGDISFASCMVNPTAIQARCRVQLDRCRDIPGIFDLAARRWDAMQESACQNEVRRCFQRDDACGENWSKCVGLDLPAMHRMCPPDRLVICSRAQPGFNIQDLNDILMGIYLALDNAALEHCNNAVNRRMMEICGSLGMCDQFARLPGFGAESLRRERLGRTNIEGVTGMVSWDLVGISAGEEWSACMTRGGRNCDRLQRPGTLLINEYLQE
ncbi:MAG: hypothetical protein FWE17_00710, partial [Alphaproteobacteria bacterium]|nr:hypothetical protein [Alphaproteobacteria bacterium]